MRKLKACIHIKAPIHTVTALTDAARRREWMTTRGWVQTLGESWEATEWEGGTRLSLQMQYRTRFAFLEPFMATSYQQSVAQSLTKLKQMAESSPN